MGDYLRQLLLSWQAALQHLAAQGAITSAARHALALEGEQQLLEQLVGEWTAGDFSRLPPIELLDGQSMHGASGAYATSTETIYLNREWLITAREKEIISILHEELGHHLDSQLNASDTPGDEGSIFAIRLAGLLPLMGEEIEDDNILIAIDREAIPAEASISHTKDFGLYQLAFSTAENGGVYLRKRETETSNTFIWEELIPAEGTYKTSTSIYSDLTISGDGLNIYVGITAQADIYWDEPILAKYSSNGTLQWTIRPEGENSLAYQQWAKLFSLELGADDFLYVRGETAKHFTTGAYIGGGSYVPFVQKIRAEDGTVIETLYQEDAETFKIPDGLVLEDSPTQANINGTLSNTDPDSGESSFQAPSPADLIGSYGTWTFDNTSGDWSYSLDNSNADIQALANGDTLTDSLIIQSSDGTGSQTIKVIIHGTNDAPLIAGDITGLVQEDSATQSITKGIVSISDPDRGESSFQALSTADTAGSYGHWTFDNTSGEWSYSLDNSNTDIQALADGDFLTDAVTVQSMDGTASQTIQVTIHGTNDAPVTYIKDYIPAYIQKSPNKSWAPFRAHQEVKNSSAFAALKSDGSVVTWGSSFSGGDSSSVSEELRDVEQIFSSGSAFAALRRDGSVVTWGASFAGGDSSGVSSSLETGVENIFSSNAAFAALKDDGSLIIWGSINGSFSNAKAAYSTGSAFAVVTEDGSVKAIGNSRYGGDAGSIPSYLNKDVKRVYSSSGAFAALRNDGRVFSWGHNSYGGDSSSVSSDLYDVKEIFSNSGSFAALRNDGSLITWGVNKFPYGKVHNVANVSSTYNAFAALTQDGRVIAWGSAFEGGSTSAFEQSLSSGVVSISATSSAFAALKEDGSIISWGEFDTGGFFSSVTSGAKQIYSNNAAFAALMNNGSVITWGSESSGGNSDNVRDELSSGVVEIYSTSSAFAALKNDGSVITWGASSGGDSSNVANELENEVLGLADPFNHDMLIPEELGTISEGEISIVNSNELRTVSGKLHATDIDSEDQLTWSVSSNGGGEYGSLEVNELTGTWLYTLNNEKGKSIGDNKEVADIYAVRAEDSLGAFSEQNVTIFLTGINDIPVITGDISGSAQEDSPAQSTTSGTLNIVDPDDGESSFQGLFTAQQVGSYGTWSFDNTSGDWSYSLDHSNADIQTLADGDSLTDSLTVQSLDGTAAQAIQVTIHGANDAPTIAGDISGSVQEDSPAQSTTSGTLIIVDPDNGESSFQGLSTADLLGSYGIWSFDNTSGDWSYSLDHSNADIQALPQGDSVTDSLSVQSLDGTASQAIQVTIHGANDAPTIAGDISGSVQEDSPAQSTTSGTLNIVDPDDGQSSFQGLSTAEQLGSYGTWSFDNTSGQWSYSLDNSNADIQALADGDSLTDSLTVQSLDGTASQAIQVTIHGANDAPTIAGDISGSIQEDSPAQSSTSGTLIIVDPDAGESSFQPLTAAEQLGSYGTWSFDNTSGDWSYSLDHSNADIQALSDGDSLTDSLAVQSLDGTAAQAIQVTIHGANDAPTIAGNISGSVQEDSAAQSTTSGTLNIVDPDDGESSFQGLSTAEQVGSYGTWSFDNTSGHWSYSLDHSNADIQALADGDSLTDSLTVQSLDGTAAQAIQVTIHGANDAPTITGSSTGSVQEDSPAQSTTSGTLNIVDPDDGQSSFQGLSTADLLGSYGTWSFDNTSGQWSYSLDHSNADIQALSDGDSLSDSLTIQSLDGTASQAIQVTIHGANDAPTFAGDISGSVQEDSAAQSTTSGTLIIVDPDDNSSFQALSTAEQLGSYGTWSFDNTSGDWSYSLDHSNADIQALSDGDSLTDSLTVQSLDGTAAQAIQVTIHGANDAPTIAGDISGSVQEDSPAQSSTSGTLIIVDPDNGESSFQGLSTADLLGSYGIWSFDNTSGQWSYSVDNSNADIQALADGDSLTDSLAVQSLDGTAAQAIQVTIHGANDAPTIAGNISGSVQEDSPAQSTTSGTLNIVDPDAGESSFQGLSTAEQVGSYGTWSFDNTSGHWSYSLDHSNADIQALADGDSLTDSLAVQSLDGTAAQAIQVTIHGANDAPTIAGDISGSVQEDSPAQSTTSGTLIIVDPDAGESSFQPLTAAEQLGSYGTWSFDNTSGDWSYSLDHSNADIQEIADGDSLTDSLSVQSLDGTAAQAIQVTIHGANDAPTIAGVISGSVQEDSPAQSTTSGTLIIVDPDDGESSFQGLSTAEQVGSYGTWSFDNTSGQWSYSLDNSNADIQALADGDSLTDSLAVQSLDGTAAQAIQVTIHGANDAPTITGDISGSVQEDSPAQSTTSGTLNIVDQDDGQSSFQGLSTAEQVGSYGTWSFDNNSGQWSYSLDNNNADIQALPHGGSLTDHLTIQSLDGTATERIEVRINGTNDAPILSFSAGEDQGSVTEDILRIASGTLSSSDIDQDSTASWSIDGSNTGTYGSISVDDNGTWTYILNDESDVDSSIVQELNEGDSVTDSFQLVVTDDKGAAKTQIVVITINGTNDNAFIGGDPKGSVTEDSWSDATGGVLRVEDPDNGEDSFHPVEENDLIGSYGYWMFDHASGDWSYSLDHSNADIQALADGDSLTDSLAVQSLDGTAAQVIQVTIHGANDAPTIAGNISGSVQEDSPTQSTTSGTLNIVDPDAGESSFQDLSTAEQVGSYGTWSIDNTSGQWSYSLDNSNADIQALPHGGSLTDHLTVQSLDGTASQAIQITIHGANDAPTIAGNNSGSVQEDSPTQSTTGGTLNIVDPDVGESSFQGLSTAEQVGSYGTWSFDNTSGDWSYSLDNNNAYIQALAKDESLTDALSIQSIDGTASETIEVIINGQKRKLPINAQVLSLTEPDLIALRSGHRTPTAINYNVAETNNRLPGIATSLYFDSSQVDIKFRPDPYQPSLFHQRIHADTYDDDSNTDTDSIISLIYQDFAGNFPGSSVSLPLTLAGLEITPTANYTGTTLNLAGSGSAGFAVIGDSLTLGYDVAPVVDQLIGDLVADALSEWSYTLPADLFVDPDSDLTLSLETSLPNWVSYDSETTTFSGTPSSSADSFQVAISASDALGSVTTGLTLNVSDVQIIASNSNTVDYQGGKSLALPLLFSATDGQPSTGISFQLFYDSSLFTFSSIDNPIDELIGHSTSVDTADADNDASTDTVLNVSIVSFTGSLASGTDLGTFNFDVADLAPADPDDPDPITGLRPSVMNLAASSTAQGYGFAADPITLEPVLFNLDVDGDGAVTALGDGLMVIRKLFGPAFAGEALTNKAISPNATRTTEEIHEYIQSGIDGGYLDVDVDDATTALGDGLMVIRRLFGPAFVGNKLIDKAISPDSPYANEGRPWEAVAENIDNLLS